MLTDSQLIIISIIATVLIKVISVVYIKRSGKRPSDLFYGLVAFVVSVALAFIWLAPKLVISPDPMEAANQLLTYAVEVIGFATLIYNVLAKKLYEVTGLSTSQLLSPTPPGGAEAPEDPLNIAPGM